jgi:glycosyltransferase involved in cell wall biosynthesis
MLDVCIVAPVNNDRIFAENLQASVPPSAGIPVRVMRGYSSASAAYNDALDQSSAEIMIFCHQDVYLPEGWIQRLAEGIDEVQKLNPNWAVIGLCGATSEGQYAGRVWCGAAGGELGKKCAVPKAVVSVDELLFVLRRSAGLRFDANLLGFHLYGTDIVQLALENGFGAYVIDAPVVHNTVQQLSLRGAYQKAYQYMAKKWRHKLPIHTVLIPLTRWGIEFQIRELKILKDRMLGQQPQNDSQRRSPALIAHRYGYRDFGRGVEPGPTAEFKDAPLCIGIVCNGDPSDFRTWSGTPLHMMEALRQEFHVTTVIRRPWAGWFVLARKVFRRLSGGRMDLIWSPKVTALAARATIRDLRQSDCEIVFAIGVTPICYSLLDGNKKLVFVSDATQAAMANYNPRRAALLPFLQEASRMMESACIQRSNMCLFPSQWARMSAITDHGGEADRMHFIPWGANMNHTEIIPPEVRDLTEWRLLFVGTVWAAKGGAIALDAVRQLRSAGRSVHLDIVGSVPPNLVEAEGVTFHGFLDKNKEVDRLRLRELFRGAHLFLLPTQFEALGIVFAEAASFALPAVSYRTGGISAMVIDGETGFLLPPGAGSERFAEAVESLMSDRAAYERTCNAALARSRERLNWPAWARAVRQVLENGAPFPDVQDNATATQCSEH